MTMAAMRMTLICLSPSPEGTRSGADRTPDPRIAGSPAVSRRTGSVVQWSVAAGGSRRSTGRSRSEDREKRTESNLTDLTGMEAGMETGTREQPGATDRLRRTVERFFQVYDTEAVDALLAEFRVHQVRGGEWLFRQGDPAD